MWHETGVQPRRSLRRRLLAFVLPAALVLGVALAVTGSAPQRLGGSTTYVAVDPYRVLAAAPLPARGSRSLPLPDVPDGALGVVLGVAATGKRATSVGVCAPRIRSSCPPALAVAAGGEQVVFAHVPLDGRPWASLQLVTGPAPVVVSLDVVAFVVPLQPADGPARPVLPTAAVAPEGRSWLRDQRIAAGAGVAVDLPEPPAAATAAVVDLTVRAPGEGLVTLWACPGERGARECDGGEVVASDGEAGRRTLLVPLDGSGRARLRGSAAVSVDADVVAFLVPGSSGAPAGSVLPLDPEAQGGEGPLAAGRPRPVELPEPPPGARGAVIGVAAGSVSAEADLTVCPGAAAGTVCARPASLSVQAGRDARTSVLVPFGAAGDAAFTLHASNDVGAVGVTHEGWVLGAAPLRTGPARGALEELTGAPGGVAIRGWAIDPASDGPATVSVDVGGTTSEVVADEARPDVVRTYPEFDGDHGFDALVPAPPGAGPVCVTIATDGTAGARSLGCREVTVLSAARAVTDVEPQDLDASSTGVPPGTALTRHDGDLVVTVAGTVVDALDVHGVVVVMADDVVIRNTRIRGRPAAQRTALVSNVLGARNLRVVDSELAPDEPSPHLYGVMGWEFVLERVNIHGVVDSVHVFGPRVTIRSSWLHDNVHFPQDPNFGGGPTHDDGVQIQAGHEILITGTRIEGAHNSAVQITQDVGVTRDVRIVDSWLDGGGCTVNVAEKQRGPIEGLVVSGNTFGRATRLPDCAVIAPPSTDLRATDNRFIDGLPARVRSGA